MKKIVASVGLVVVSAGFSAVQAQDVVPTSPEKPWSISASLRGFYDDNIGTYPDGSTNKISSYGIQVQPGVAYQLQNEQTTLTASYLFTYRYYDKELPNRNGNDSYDHNFSLDFTHAFNERYNMGVSDTFVVGQEPDQFRPNVIYLDKQWVPGDNMRNEGTVNFNMELTPLFALGLVYNNSWFDYHDSTVSVYNNGTVAPSLSGTLDRIGNFFSVDGRWHVAPETVGVLSGTFGWVDFTGDQLISGLVVGLNPLTVVGGQMSDSRNFRVYRLDVGADHNFTPDFIGSARVGGSYYDYYNAQDNNNNLTPYARASLRYIYAPGSSIESGLTYDRHPTDVVAPDARGNLTKEEETFAIFATVAHQITPDFTGSLTGQIQNGTFISGAYDGQSEQYYTLGLHFAYKLNPFLTADCGYNYDNLSSDIPGRNYDRNRVYIGLAASY